MKIVSTGILIVLILLAISSGVTKIMLMEQDVEFFGKYGFTNPILIAYGLAQLVGALLLVFAQTRFYGAAVVAATFIISLVVLLMEGNIAVSVATAVATTALVAIMFRSREAWGRSKGSE